MSPLWHRGRLADTAIPGVITLWHEQTPSPRLLTVFTAWECKIFTDPMDVSQGCDGQRIQGCACTEELLVVLGEPGPILPRAKLIVWSLPCCRCICCSSSKGTKQMPPLRASPWLLLCSSWSELREGWGSQDPEMLGKPSSRSQPHSQDNTICSRGLCEH